MIEPAIVSVRLLQYTGAMILMGSSLFLVYALPGSGRTSARWARPLVGGAAALLALSSLLAIPVQASLFAGTFGDGFNATAMGAVITEMPLGKAAVARSASAALALAVLLAWPRGRATWPVVATLGTIATASLAWMGHGAASEGGVGAAHLASDICHAFAAAIWVGALVALLLLTLDRSADGRHEGTLHGALRTFSGVGSIAVAVLLVTGLVTARSSWGWTGPVT